MGEGNAGCTRAVDSAVLQRTEVCCMTKALLGEKVQMVHEVETTPLTQKL